MKNVLIILVAVIVLLPIGGMAQGTNESNVTKFSISTAYIGFDDNWFASKILVNITTIRFGRLVYVEEYFTVDSNDNPKPVTSGTYYDNNVTENNISFQILRPLYRSGKFYSMIRGVIIIDGKRVYERWLKIVDGAHLTFTIGNGNKNDIAAKINNIAKFEIEYNDLIADFPVTYKLMVSEIPIYEVDVISMENEGDTSLRVELLKGIPDFVGSFHWAAYKYLDISMGTYKIKKIIPRYKIENLWIKSNNLSIYDIRLFRWNKDDRMWHALKTTILNNDDNYTYYQSETTNLSIFVIAELNRTVRDDYINRTVIANMMKNNISIDINQTINTLDNKANISEKEKLPRATTDNEDNKDNKEYMIIGVILSMIAIIISTYVIIRNRKIQKMLEKK